jgi:hypothetical protein
MFRSHTRSMSAAGKQICRKEREDAGSKQREAFAPYTLPAGAGASDNGPVPVGSFHSQYLEFLLRRSKPMGPTAAQVCVGVIKKKEGVVGTEA